VEERKKIEQMEILNERTLQPNSALKNVFSYQSLYERSCMGNCTSWTFIQWEIWFHFTMAISDGSCSL